MKWKIRKIPQAIIFWYRDLWNKHSHFEEEVYIQKREIIGDYICTYIFLKRENSGSQIFTKYKDAVVFAKKIMEGGL